MVAIKTSLALPSLTKSVSSRSNSPAPSPAPSNTGEKRSMLDSLPRSRSRSGEGTKRPPTDTSPLAHPGVPVLSAGSTLRPKLTSLLSGRSTPSHPPGTPLLSPGSAAFPHVNIHGGAHTSNSTPASGNGAAHPNAGGMNGAAAISMLEASYVTKVGTALNDAVNKVFPSPANFVAGAVNHGSAVGDAALVTYKGLCAPRVDKAKEVGRMIDTELHLAVNDQYLLRSLLRSAVLKSLSIFLSRLESLMISPTADPTILYVARSIKEAENPPLIQRYSFLVLRSAWELRKGLLKACSNSIRADGKEEEMPKFVNDTLAPWITKVELLANKLWSPMLAAIKDEATKFVVHRCHEEGLSSMNSVAAHLAVPSSSNGPRSLSFTRSANTHSTSTLLGASVVPASASHPACAYLKDLGSLLSATSRTFAWLSGADSEIQKWKVSIGSSVIWKMLLTTSSTTFGHQSENQLRRHLTPPLGTIHFANDAAPPTKRSMSAMGMGRLRGSNAPSGKRSPSPPRVLASTKLVAEMEAFESILEKFVASLLIHSHEPHASAHTNPNEAACSMDKDCAVCKGRYIPLDVEDSDDEEALPREAMQEAMTALSSFIVILRAFASEAQPVRTILKAIAAVDDIALASDVCPNLIRALDTIPPLILLQMVVARIPSYYGVRLPHELWSTTWKDYEQTMKGFHTGEEWVGEVGWELLKEVRRVQERLTKEYEAEEGEDRDKVDEEGWLALLNLAVTELAEVDDLDEDLSAPTISVANGMDPASAARQ